jgi:polynucleotide 5'-kinase involved in rRNA processing
MLKLQAAYKETRSIPVCKYLVMGESRSGKSTLGTRIVNAGSSPN